MAETWTVNGWLESRYFRRKKFRKSPAAGPKPPKNPPKMAKNGPFQNRKSRNIQYYTARPICPNFCTSKLDRCECVVMFFDFWIFFLALSYGPSNLEKVSESEKNGLFFRTRFTPRRSGGTVLNFFIIWIARKWNFHIKPTPARSEVGAAHYGPPKSRYVLKYVLKSS